MATIKPFVLPGNLGKVVVETSVPSSPTRLVKEFNKLLQTPGDSRIRNLKRFLRDVDQQLLRQLVNERFDDNHFDGEYSHQTPLAQAILQDDGNLTKLLLKYGADPTIMPCSLRGDRSLSIPIVNHVHFAVVKFCHQDVLNPLIDYSPTVIKDMPIFSQFSILNYAAKCADAVLARKLLEQMTGKLDMADRKQMGKAALHLAIMDDNIPVVKLLLQMGASVNQPDIQGKTPLMCAVERQNPTLLTILIRAGADVNMVDSQGRSALHLSASKTSVPMVRILLDAGSDTSVKATTGKLPIDLALNLSRRRSSLAPNSQSLPGEAKAEVLQLLLSTPQSPLVFTEQQFQHIVFCLIKYGAKTIDDLVIKLMLINNNYFKLRSIERPEIPLLHAAVGAGRLVLATWLLDHGASIKETDEDGWMPVHHACTAAGGDVTRCLQVLLQSGASMNDLTPENWSPLWLLLRYDHPDSAEYIIQANKHIDLTREISINELRQMNISLKLPTTLYDPKTIDEKGALQGAKEGKRKVSMNTFALHCGYDKVADLITQRFEP